MNKKNNLDTIEKLNQLNKEQLRTVILFMLRDTLNWSTNIRVVDMIRQHNAMQYEAIKHQINKAYTKLVKEEE
jgi:hypothetical protein